MGFHLSLPEIKAIFWSNPSQVLPHICDDKFNLTFAKQRDNLIRTQCPDA